MKNYYSVLAFWAFITTFQSQDLKLLDLSEWQEQIVLDSLLDENSGLEYADDFIYTFNDSGGDAAVYKVDPNSGKVVQTIKFKKIKNVDFEDIAFDGKILYVGDFGNNMGNREQKFIYSFDLSKIKSKDSLVEIHPRKMTFIIDTEDWNSKKEPHTTNYDIESLLYYDGKLHIFTKEWTSAKTTHYTLETNYAYQGAKKIEEFDTKCFITGSDVLDNTLLMTGYTRDGEVYLWKFTDFSEGKFFNGKHQEYMLGLSPAIGQIEGVVIGGDKFFISGEKFSKFGFECLQKIYAIPIDQIQ